MEVMELVNLIVLGKLGVTERGALNILADKDLCLRIANEDIIEFNDALDKFNITKPKLKSLINNKMLTVIKNGYMARGRKSWLFEDELSTLDNLNFYVQINYYKFVQQAYSAFRDLYKTILIERNSYVVDRIVRYNSTPEELGLELGLTKSRIIQIYNKGIRQIHYYHKKLKKYKELKEAILELTEKQKKLIEENEFWESNIIKNRAEVGSKSTYVDPEIDDIKKYDLNRRAINCLLGTDINTATELISYFEENAFCELLRSPNLGKKSFLEIINFMQNELKYTFKPKTLDEKIQMTRYGINVISG